MDAAEPNLSTAGTVFLSYTRADQPRAKQVIALLEQNGLKVWWDGLLEGGESFLPTTEAALEGADCVVVLWSKLSVASHWVRDEAQRGRERGCLVPLGLDGTDPPLGFRQFQVIDVSRWNGKGDGAPADHIVRAVLARTSGEASGLPRPLPPGSAHLSRRILIGGGLGIAGAAGLGAWKLGFFGKPGLGSNSIAVMPFKNLSAGNEQAWFSDGLSNELRAALARNSFLRVAAPASSVSLREEPADEFAIASKLGVANLLRGSVQRAGDTVRISVELVRAADAVVRWAQTYDRKMKDVLAVQSEIARTVAVSMVEDVFGKDDALRGAEQQRDVGGTGNVAAYEAYLRGTALYDLSAGEDTDRAALAQFDAATALDPAYASAHAMRSTMLAAVANAAGNLQEIRALYDAAIGAAKRAIELAPDLARGHLALGFALNNGKLDTRGARPHYRRARELAPGDADVLRAVASFNAFSDDPRIAAELIARVLELDPLNPRAFRSAGNIAYARRDYDEAIALLSRALSFNAKLASANFFVGNALYLKGDHPGALRTYQRETVKVFQLAGIAMAQAKLGDSAAARAALDEMVAANGDSCLYQQAQVLTQWNDLEGALSRLEKALKLRDSGLLLVRTDPMLDPLRKAGRLAGLLSTLDP